MFFFFFPPTPNQNRWVLAARPAAAFQKESQCADTFDPYLGLFSFPSRATRSGNADERVFAQADTHTPDPSQLGGGLTDCHTQVLFLRHAGILQTAGVNFNWCSGPVRSASLAGSSAAAGGNGLLSRAHIRLFSSRSIRTS